MTRNHVVFLASIVLLGFAPLSAQAFSGAGAGKLQSARILRLDQVALTDPASASERTTKTEVADPTGEEPGTITVDTKNFYLYLSQPDGRALRYSVGVGREGYAWKGVARIGRKAEWPTWTPPAAMLLRRPSLPRVMAGGIDNPLGARALYLYDGNHDTDFRIHGTNDPTTVGKSMSSGCIRMLNADVMDLFNRVGVGTTVKVI